MDRSAFQPDNPIGIFDSGVGGLTVLEAIIDLLPGENFIYYADSGNCPYGERTKEEILELASNITSFLVERNCKLIVVACNTITTNIIDHLREKFAVPFVGMEPAIKPAAKLTSTGNVAVLATKGTLEGELYNRTRELHASDITVTNIPGTGLVKLIEANALESPAMEAALGDILTTIREKEIDTLVLGCTHYNYLVPIIRNMIPADILHVLNSAAPVARRVRSLLEKDHLLNPQIEGNVILHTTGDPDLLDVIAQRLDLGTFTISHIDK